jgi:hypothetical protein
MKPINTSHTCIAKNINELGWRPQLIINEKIAAYGTQQPDFSPEVGAVGRILGGKSHKDVIDNLKPIADSFIHTKEMRNLHSSGLQSTTAYLKTSSHKLPSHAKY